jgi:serine/threonine protein kinase
MLKPKLQGIAEEVSGKLALTLGAFAGGGSFKETYRALTSSDQVVALKVFDPSCSDLARAERELDAMKKCDSSRVAQLYEWGVVSSRDGIEHIYVIEEFFDGGTLTERLACGVLAPREVRLLGLALVQSLRELASHRLVHRDIKPDNIMFRSGDDLPVLVDFGLVRDTSRSSLTPTFLPSGPGTPFYASPEQLNNDKHLIDWRTDQFCLGVVLGYCLSGRHPYWRDGMNNGQVVSLVAERECCSSWFQEEAIKAGLGVITKMVEPWPVERFTTPDQLVEALGNTEG